MTQSPTLADIQSVFLDDVYNRTTNSVGLLDDSNPAYAERLSVYVNNTFFGLLEVLQSIFPVTENLLGEEFFKHMVRGYIVQSPLGKGNALSIGEKFSNYLAPMAEQHNVAYVADVARIEWAKSHAYFADDAPIATLESITNAMQENPDCVLHLHPSSIVVHVCHNALDIMRAVENERIDDIAVAKQNHTILVWRNCVDDEPVLYSVPPIMGDFLQGCIAQNSFGNIMGTLSTQYPDSDMASLQQDFSSCVSAGAFTLSPPVL